MPISIEAFKRTFQKVAQSNQVNYDVRRAKCQAAVDPLKRAVAHLQTNGAERGVLLQHAVELQALLKLLDDADAKALKNPGDAFKDLEAVKKRARLAAQAASSATKKVPMPVISQDGKTSAKVYPTDVPGFAKMSDAQRQQVVQQIANKIGKGKDLFAQVQKNPAFLKTWAPTQEDVADLMWFIKNRAQESLGEAYERGAVTLPDDGGVTQRLLDRCSEAYIRDSSHMSGQQKLAGGQARGIDFYDGMDDGEIADTGHLLPAGMRTVLYQKITTAQGQQRLYIKMETESARVRAKFFTKDFYREEIASRPREWKDWSNSIRHLGNLIKAKLDMSQGEDKDLRAFREQVPKIIGKHIDAALSAAKDSGSEEAIEAMQGLKASVKSGIGQIWAQYEAIAEAGIDMDASVYTHLAQMAQAIFDLAPKVDADERLGGEVVLKLDDLRTDTTAQEILLTLKPRTDLAKTAGATSYITTQKRTVVDLLTSIDALIAGGDSAGTVPLLSQLAQALGVMEEAISAYEQHLAHFTSAKNGAVKAALATQLAPAKLAAARDKALAATEERIKKFADKGSVQKKADPLLAQWIHEAQAWKQSKSAWDSMAVGDKPDKKVLNQLIALPGGGKVLDALVAGLDEGRPEQILKDVIEVRFGVKVKRFERMDPDNLQNEKGLTPIAPKTPDKALKKMYELFCQVPLHNVKGKVTELIQFDQNDGGAAALGTTGKIWMYCGNPGDKGASQQKFGSKGGVVPADESIETAFQPRDEEDVPYFDFAALHEVGHVIDAKRGIMADAAYKGIAGWQEHGSDAVAVIAAAHFNYDEAFVKAVLASKSHTIPKATPAPKKGVTPTDWGKARDAVLAWCKNVRVAASPWFDPGVCKKVAIDGRVYQESYSGRWVSYLLSARSKGITSYQFRAPGEWFAELYAAYFSGKLKKEHPYASWLKTLKKDN